MVEGNPGKHALLFSTVVLLWVDSPSCCCGSQTCVCERQGGEWPKLHLPQVVVLLIGTNDVPAFDCGTEDALLEAVPQILLVVSGLLGAVGAARHVILVGLLPRDTSFWVPEEQWVYPNRYTAAIHQINQGFAVRPATPIFCLVLKTAPHRVLTTADTMKLPSLFLRSQRCCLQDIAAADATRYTYLDCGREFTNSTGLRRDMYVEGLHPSSAGNQVLLDCMLQGVKKHVVSVSPAK